MAPRSAGGVVPAAPSFAFAASDTSDVDDGLAATSLLVPPPLKARNAWRLSDSLRVASHVT